LGDGPFALDDHLSIERSGGASRSTQDMYVDPFVTRSHSRDAPHPLLHSRERPRDIKMNDYVGVLQIHSLT
jgi:hypothetical protein